MVLLYNSRLRLFPCKLKSRWIGPCIVIVVYSSWAIKIRFENEKFVVNSAQLKKYFPSVPIQIFLKLKEDILVQGSPRLEEIEDDPKV